MTRRQAYNVVWRPLGFDGDPAREAAWHGRLALEKVDEGDVAMAEMYARRAARCALAARHPEIDMDAPLDLA